MYPEEISFFTGRGWHRAGWALEHPGTQGALGARTPDSGAVWSIQKLQCLGGETQPHDGGPCSSLHPGSCSAIGHEEGDQIPTRSPTESQPRTWQLFGSFPRRPQPPSPETGLLPPLAGALAEHSSAWQHQLFSEQEESRAPAQIARLSQRAPGPVICPDCQRESW